MRPIVAIVRLEFARLLRARTSFTLLLLVPALQVMLFGYAIRPQSQAIRVAIAAPSAKAAEPIIAQLRNEKDLLLLGGVRRPGQAQVEVESGNALIAIEIPETRSFANPIAPIRPLRIIIDATNAGLTEAAAARIEAAYWRDIAQIWDDSSAEQAPVIEQRYNPQGRADWTFLPALIGVTVMISMIMLGCLSLAREREAGTWEALLALPISRGQLLSGKMLPYAVLGTLQGLLVLMAAIWVFDLPTRGPVIVLIALLPPFAAAHFLIGYLISARAATQIDALQGAVAFYLPAMLLSGFLYPFETLPKWAQTIGSLFPLTHFIAAARDILLKGYGTAAVAADIVPIIAALLVVAVACFFLQKRRLD